MRLFCIVFIFLVSVSQSLVGSLIYAGPQIMLNNLFYLFYHTWKNYYFATSEFFYLFLLSLSQHLIVFSAKWWGRGHRGLEWVVAPLINEDVKLCYKTKILKRLACLTNYFTCCPAYALIMNVQCGWLWHLFNFSTT